MEETSKTSSKSLTKEEYDLLQMQDKRWVTKYRANLLETNARKYWDLFYKRNETRFFKDRHWTKREFIELLDEATSTSNLKRFILEVGCGVGNFVFPLIEENSNFFIFACDFSPRAIEFVKSNELYTEDCIKAFVCDITTSDIFSVIDVNSINIVTLVFVLSAIHPDKFATVLSNLVKVLKPGGVVLFRDYGIYDMAQLRFKPGSKVAENLYMRQDGTRSYYFALDALNKLFISAGFDVVDSSYVHRRTVNKKENLDIPRIFIQGKFRKPLCT